MPIGSPFVLYPAGNEIAGRPARLAGVAKQINFVALERSETPIWSEATGMNEATRAVIESIDGLMFTPPGQPDSCPRSPDIWFMASSQLGGDRYNIAVANSFATREASSRAI